jgi:CBS domain-containing protein
MARTVYEEMLPRWLSTRLSAKPPPQEDAAARWPLLATLAAPVFTGLATAWFLRGRGPALWSKRVRDVMVDEVVTIDPSATLADAARQMRDHNVGILPVIVDGELAGVITDRDLVVRALAEGADPMLTFVGEFASGAPIAVHPDTGLDETMEIMGEWQVGRLPVVDHDNRLVGIVTLGSLALRSRQGAETLHAAQAVSQRSARAA